MASGTVPRGLHVLAGRWFDLQSAYQTAFADFLCFYYKESAFGFCCLFWLHQGGIPHRMCRFYCCLAAHQRTRKKDSAEPSFPILWTPPHPPGGIRCGGAFWLPRAYRDIVSLYPVLSLLASSEYGLAVCVRAGIVRVSVGLLGLYRTFFIIGGVDRLFLRLRWVWLWSIVGFALTANGAFVGMITVRSFCIVRSLDCMEYLYRRCGITCIVR